MKLEDLKVGMTVCWNGEISENVNNSDRIIVAVEEGSYLYRFVGGVACYRSYSGNLQWYEPATVSLTEHQEKLLDTISAAGEGVKVESITTAESVTHQLAKAYNVPIEELIKPMPSKGILSWQEAKTIKDVCGIDIGSKTKVIPPSGQISTEPVQRQNCEESDLIQQAVGMCRIAKIITGKPYRTVFMSNEKITIEPIPDNVFKEDVPAPAQPPIQDRIPPKTWN